MRSVAGKRGTFKEDLEEELSVTEVEIMLYKSGIDDRRKYCLQNVNSPVKTRSEVQQMNMNQENLRIEWSSWDCL